MRETPFSALPVAVGYILLLVAPSAPWSMTASARIENLEKIGLSELRTQTQTFMFQPQLDPARTEVPFTAKANIRARLKLQWFRCLTIQSSACTSMKGF
jgi:hypothetical protein